MSRTDENYLRLLRARYRKVSREERSAIPDESVKTTRYHRKHAIGSLNGRRPRYRACIRRPRSAIQGPEEAGELLILWALFDHVHSKRLRRASDVESDGLHRSRFCQVRS